jgi:hypothetical protein
MEKGNEGTILSWKALSKCLEICIWPIEKELKP